MFRRPGPSPPIAVGHFFSLHSLMGKAVTRKAGGRKGRKVGGTRRVKAGGRKTIRKTGGSRRRGQRGGCGLMCGLWHGAVVAEKGGD